MRKPYLRLRHLVEDKGLELKDLPALTGIPRSTLNGIINAPESDGKWRWKDIVVLCKLLDIPPEEIGKYFFPELAKERPA